MKDETVSAVRVNDSVFRAPVESDDPRSGQPLAQILGEGTAKVGTPQLDGRDPTPLQHSLEASDRGFDFRKLGHERDMAKALEAR
jgi:hypothetical protein